VLHFRGLSDAPGQSTVAVTIAIVLLLPAWLIATFVFQPFGHRQWAFTAAGLLLTWVIARSRFRVAPSTESATPFKRLRHYFFRLGQGTWICALLCSLGLITWSAVAPAGSMPAAKSDPAAIRVVTWNILVGTEHGMWWRRHGWGVRKSALRTAISAAKPDILCVQEALDEQLRFLDQVLPGHRRVGVGRDDGNSAGEHCAIFFDDARFRHQGSGTFWLEEPVEEPPEHRHRGPKRICSWVRLEDRDTGRSFRVYNMHNYLTEGARVRAVRIILKRINMNDVAEPTIVTGDFNAPPEGRDRRLLEASGLVSSAHLAGARLDTPTYQFYGIRLRSLDEILVSGHWQVLHHRVLDVKPANTYPSDHFGVLADLVLETTDPPGPR
jgi:endonuclease/exonuclease/phosphatase family metal-dependent hydrolase